MTNRSAGLTSVIVAALIAAVLVGSQVLATAGPATPRLKQPAPAATSTADDGDCVNDACGSGHSKAVHAWVKCKAVNGKDACVRPAPPGDAHRRTNHSGTAPGPASANGHGHGWGRAHARDQLKNKGEPTPHDDQDANDPND
jgi:uncharacterized low-complexity protein